MSHNYPIFTLSPSASDLSQRRKKVGRLWLRCNGGSATTPLHPPPSHRSTTPISPLATTKPAVGCARCRRKFFLQNQLHGFSAFIESSSGTPARTLWASVMVVCLVMAIWHTYVLASDYFQHPVITLNTIKKRDKLLYPNITVCPKNADALNFSDIEADLRFRMPHLNDTAINDLIAFAMAGAGFHNFDAQIQFWRSDQLLVFSRWFTKWRAGRSLQQFFQFLFEENGYRCEDFFHLCTYGRRALPCCDHFSPTYVMLRGRCFRLKEAYQEDPDESGKLSLFFKQLHSPFSNMKGLQPQVMAYISDGLDDIPTFPRFYLNPQVFEKIHSFHPSLASVVVQKWHRFRFKKRQITMISQNAYCSNEEQRGRSSCLVDTWLHERVVKPLNCTLFYFTHKTPGMRICEPARIVKNYRNILLVGYNEAYRPVQFNCLPACNREYLDTHLTLSGKQVSSLQPITPFHMSLSYENLQVDLYEEVLTTSMPGFISQIGGQFGFFLGISVITMTQVLMHLLDPTRHWLHDKDVVLAMQDYWLKWKVSRG